MTDDQFEDAKRLYTEQGWSMLRCATHLRVCRMALTERMREAGVTIRGKREGQEMRHKAPVCAAPEAAWRKALAGQRYEDDPRAPVPRNHVRMDAPRLEWRAL